MANEIGSNLIPQYTDFKIKFEPVTLNSDTLSFTSIGKWIFAIGTSVEAVPTVVKNSAVNASDFIINTGTYSVTVSVRGSEISNGYGTYYVALFAETSGAITGHLSKNITIERNIRPTGV